MPPTAKPIKERLEAKCMPEPNTGCWIWLGSANSEGRAQMGSRTAARVSYAAYKGPIPEGLSVLHRCDEPICVNPDHLFLGTHTDNMRDMSRKGRGRWNVPSRPCAYQDKRTRRWRAYYYANGRQTHVGNFPSRDEALAAGAAALAAR